MTKSIKLSEPDWVTLYDRIKKDYPKSVWIIREKMRSSLGFVPRKHEEWLEVDKNSLIYPGYKMRFPNHTIYLDFYDEYKKTIFILKYSKYLKLTDT